MELPTFWCGAAGRRFRTPPLRALAAWNSPPLVRCSWQASPYAALAGAGCVELPTSGAVQLAGVSVRHPRRPMRCRDLHADRAPHRPIPPMRGDLLCAWSVTCTTALCWSVASTSCLDEQKSCHPSAPTWSSAVVAGQWPPRATPTSRSCAGLWPPRTALCWPMASTRTRVGAVLVYVASRSALCWSV